MQLVGSSVGFAALCRANQGALAPMLLFMKGSEWGYGQIPAEREESVQTWKLWIAQNPQAVDYSTFVNDATLTVSGSKTDAFSVVLADHAAMNFWTLIVRYRGANSAGAISVEVPEVIRGDKLVPLAPAAEEAFFRGVGKIKGASAFWA